MIANCALLPTVPYYQLCPITNCTLLPTVRYITNQPNIMLDEITLWKYYITALIIWLVINNLTKFGKENQNSSCGKVEFKDVKDLCTTLDCLSF